MSYTVATFTVNPPVPFKLLYKTFLPAHLVVNSQAAAGVSPAEAEEMVGVIWSAQYLPPGVLCAFAGAETADSDVPGSSCLAPFTHGVRFRCGDRQVHPVTLAASCACHPITRSVLPYMLMTVKPS